MSHFFIRPMSNKNWPYASKIWDFFSYKNAVYNSQRYNI